MFRVGLAPDKMALKFLCNNELNYLNNILFSKVNSSRNIKLEVEYEIKIFKTGYSIEE